ncbi:IclR family transcriptional regulator [Antarcticimicrobium luteum]|uniref:IclR family transcriptional regulator n=1 Tax=Antarcticimicrobium luteum TaxID=2547397 RepID=A0A4V3AR88_9RHOB|nr:IclR family transcriptional regulator [Antarcticimicrobium luteum]TDK45667.1 IclR family transcriptional regulator [Antarcticimicrobium luteum]
MTAKNGVAAVERALSILDAFRDTDGRLSLTELAQKTGLYKSTILRLLASLEAYGYVRKLDDRGYQIGPKFVELAGIYQETFRIGDIVMPMLERIVNEVNESASYFVREGKMRLCLFRVDARQEIRDHIRVGDTRPLDRGASGKALIRYSGKRASDAGRDGLVFTSFGERNPDMAAMAAPVFGLGNTLSGCINISGPRTRFSPERVAEITPVLQRAAVELSIQAGASPEILKRLLPAEKDPRS